jgi:hypothetical protein
VFRYDGPLPSGVLLEPNGIKSFCAHIAIFSILKMKTLSLTTLFALLALASILSGCQTAQNSQQSAAPTVSGYVSVGADKTVH